jgi:FAD:protein FMN transferase
MKNQRKKIIVVSIAVILILSLVSGCSKKEAVEPVKKTVYALDTICNITIYDKASDAVFDKCFAALKDVENKMSVDIKNSEVSQINDNAGLKFVKVSDDTYYVIKNGASFGDLTNGKFDITVGPLVKLWGINTPRARIPAPIEIKTALPLINYKNVLFNDKDKSIMLKNKGMSLDLGGIAKGFSGDVVAKVLKENGIKHAIIDLGGNILTVGSKPDGSAWRVGVQNPLSPRGDYLGIVSVKNKAVVTSGIYERFFIKNGKRYHHIMDTKTGYPVDNELASVSIVTDASINADALAKAFCMGVKAGLIFIEKQKGVEAIFVTKDSKVYITPGLKSIFRVTDSSFKLMN